MDERLAAVGYQWRRIVFWMFSTMAALGLVFLAVGFLLPNSWEVERSVTIDAPAERVFGFVNSIAGWEQWTPWPDAEAQVLGPQEGVGAAKSWNDPEWGEGVFTIVQSEPPRMVGYEVLVEGGSIMTRGRITLIPAGNSVEVSWREEGDFGWNPFLSYMALAMDFLQGRELEKGLAKLKDTAEAP